IRPSRLLRWSQPVVLLALLGVGAGDQLVELAGGPGAFGAAGGGGGAPVKQLGGGLPGAGGARIHARLRCAARLGGGVGGAPRAGGGAHWHLSLFVSYLPMVLLLLPAAFVGSRWYVDGGAPDAKGATEPGPVVFRLLLPLCLVMTFAYIGDSTVSNWSAK